MDDDETPDSQYSEYILGSFRTRIKKYSQGVHISSYYSMAGSCSAKDFSDAVFQEYSNLSACNEVVNIVFRYVNVFGHYNHLSIKRSDIQQYGFGRVLRRILTLEHDMSLYQGSDHIASLLSEDNDYYLSTRFFAIVYKPRIGGMLVDACSFIYCEAVDVTENVYDCFFDCVRFATGNFSSFDTISFRRSHGMRLNMGIPVSKIPLCEAAMNIKICVVEDDVTILREGSSSTIYPKVIYGTLGIGVTLLLKGGHYYVFWRLKDERSLLECLDRKENIPVHASPKKEFLFFSYRTVSDPSTAEVIPYSALIPVSYTHLTLPTICSV
eukprot:TRINITY_DN501_c0_g1_i8.p1 TRINITY_DN501_c0_g1~~TRINITY_DN501_c0_g1_i8.p1  ORF type:complete len:325 (+),score=8.14 TRINITY_DN501_c0_g1_i8:354-1328(+)